MIDPRSLYPALLGPAWDSLPVKIREAHSHGAAVALSGTLRVEVGGGVLAWFTRLLLGLPLRGRDVQANLLIHPYPRHEIWKREIGSWKFTTRQQDHGGVLRERYGPLVFDFRLMIKNDELEYRQVALGFDLGFVRLPVPSVLGPKIYAREELAPDPLHNTKLTVRLEWALVGLVVAYGGFLRAA